MEIVPKVKREFFTETEILGQPDLWLKLWKSYQANKNSLKKFLEKFINNDEVSIILTGAGTSAYIGDVLLGAFNKNYCNHVSSIATTDLITHPEQYFNKSKKYLLISFARSGDSPESSQAILLSEQLSKKVKRINI